MKIRCKKGAWPQRSRSRSVSRLSAKPAIVLRPQSKQLAAFLQKPGAAFIKRRARVSRSPPSSSATSEGGRGADTTLQTPAARSTAGDDPAWVTRVQLPPLRAVREPLSTGRRRSRPVRCRRAANRWFWGREGGETCFAVQTRQRQRVS